MADPANKKTIFSKREFIKSWASIDKDDEKMGVVLLLEPTPDFYLNVDEKYDKATFSFLSKYIRPHQKFIAQLIIGLLTGSVIQVIFPFLTQAIVDIGIGTQNTNFLVLVLVAQIFLVASRIGVDFIRSWLLLHISTRINVSLISDFLIKLMKLPASFFDKKHTGDIIQRIEDHNRIEEFLTSQSLTFVFSIFNIFIFTLVLIYFSFSVFSIFSIGSLAYVGWVLVFMKYRRNLDHRRFAELSKEQNNIIQLIEGMQEIKLNNCEREKRWEWERIQAKIFNPT